MISLSHSPEHAAQTVPPQVDRVRQISRLLLNPPLYAFMWLFFGLQSAPHLFGSGVLTTALEGGLCTIGGVLAMLARRRGRFARLEDFRPRLPLQLAGLLPWIPAFAILGIGLVGGVILRFPATGGFLVLLLVPMFVFLGLGWWLNPWWPRIALMLACSVAAALMLVRPPPPQLRWETVLLLFFGSAALSNLVDQGHLYKLLGETDREADDVAV
jgi:hypothetical protein